MSFLERFFDNISPGRWWTENFHNELALFRKNRPDVSVMADSIKRPCMDVVYYIDANDRKYVEFYCEREKAKNRYEALKSRLGVHDIKWLIVSKISDTPPITYPFGKNETFS